jgi:hypothetical protein
MRIRLPAQERSRRSGVVLQAERLGQADAEVPSLAVHVGLHGDAQRVPTTATAEVATVDDRVKLRQKMHEILQALCAFTATPIQTARLNFESRRRRLQLEWRATPESAPSERSVLCVCELHIRNRSL